MTLADRRPSHPLWTRVLGIAGIVVHLGVGYFYLAAGLVVPGPWLVVFLLVWVALLVLGIHLVRRAPLWAMLVPVVGLGFLIGGVSLGGALLGWSA